MTYIYKKGCKRAEPAYHYINAQPSSNFEPKQDCFNQVFAIIRLLFFFLHFLGLRNVSVIYLEHSGFIYFFCLIKK